MAIRPPSSIPFFAVSTKMPADEKVLGIPITQRAEAIGTWTLCGCWSADNLKDGFVPTVVIESQGGTLEGAAALVKARMWKRARGGFQFQNWERYNFTREQVETKRAEERQRKADWRAKKEAKGQADSGGETDVSHGTNVSVPSIPIPIPIPIPNKGLGSTEQSPARPAPKDDPQPCGRVHDPARPCRACAKVAADIEAEKARAKAAKERARNKAEADARKADAANTPPDDGTGPEKARAAVKEALAKEKS